MPKLPVAPKLEFFNSLMMFVVPKGTSSHNIINAPKELKLYLETGHWIYPELKRSIIG